MSEHTYTNKKENEKKQNKTKPKNRLRKTNKTNTKKRIKITVVVGGKGKRW